MVFLGILAGLIGSGHVSLPVAAAMAAAVWLWRSACLAGLLRKAGAGAAWGFVPFAGSWKLSRAVAGSGAASLLLLVPVLGTLWRFLFDRMTAARYGMSVLFGTCMFFVPVLFYTWLAFGPARYSSVPARIGRARDAKGYEGGGYVEGLYDGPDAGGPGKRDAELEELRRRYERRYGKE